MNTGCFSWYNTYLGQWIGSLTEISPGHVYLIFVQPGHNSFEWIYNPFGEKSVRQYNQLKGIHIVAYFPELKTIEDFDNIINLENDFFNHCDYIITFGEVYENFLIKNYGH